MFNLINLIMLLLIVTALMEVELEKENPLSHHSSRSCFLPALCVHIILCSCDYITIEFLFFLLYLYHYKERSLVLSNGTAFVQIHLCG